MSKISVANLAGSAETLLIPLYYRALESQEGYSRFRDDKALEIANCLDYDFSKIHAKALSREGVILRAQQFDHLVSHFLIQNPTGTVIEIGCGLDTRSYRLDNGSVTWVDLDLPEVIALRKQLLTETPRHQFVEQSVLDYAWMNKVHVQPEQRVFLVAEAVFPYLAQQDVKTLLLRLACTYPGSEIIFDSVPPVFAKFGGRWHPNLWHTKARICWGMGQAQTVEGWSKDICFLGQYPYYLEKSRHRNRFSRLFSFFFKQFKIVHYQIGEQHPSCTGGSYEPNKIKSTGG